MKNKIINRFLIKGAIFTMSFTLGLVIANFILNFEFSLIDNNNVRVLLENTIEYKHSKVPRCKPNPLLLVIQADKFGNLRVNNEMKSNLDNLVELEIFLKEIFQERKKNGVYEEDTENVVKEVIVVPNETIFGNDLFSLVQSLERVGASPIKIDWNKRLKNCILGVSCKRFYIEKSN